MGDAPTQGALFFPSEIEGGVLAGHVCFDIGLDAHSNFAHKNNYGMAVRHAS